MINAYRLIRQIVCRHITTSMLIVLIGLIGKTPYAHGMSPDNLFKKPWKDELNINSYESKPGSATLMHVTGSVGDLLVSNDWLSQALIKNNDGLSSEFLCNMLSRAHASENVVLADSITRILEQRGHTIAMQIDEAPNKKRNRDELSHQENKRYKGAI